VVAAGQASFPSNLESGLAFWEGRYDHGPKPELSDFDFLSEKQRTALTQLIDIGYHLTANGHTKDRRFFEENGYLALYLSGLNPVLTMQNNRVGIWQLTYADARRYGLKITELIDERRDAVKSSFAARRYFEELERIHGGQEAPLRFVMGPAAYSQASIQERKEILETLEALRTAFENYDPHQLKAKESQMVLQSFSDWVYLDMLLDTVAIGREEFRRYNPVLTGYAIPAGFGVYLPDQVPTHELVVASREREKLRKEAFKQRLAQIRRNAPSSETHRAITHVVKSGDVLGRIAMKYGVPVYPFCCWWRILRDFLVFWIVDREFLTNIDTV
jgi:hypothetical protein